MDTAGNNSSILTTTLSTSTSVPVTTTVKTTTTTVVAATATAFLNHSLGISNETRKTTEIPHLTDSSVQRLSSTTIISNIVNTTQSVLDGFKSTISTTVNTQVKNATIKNNGCITSGVTTTTEEPYDDFGPPEGVEYIFVPVGVMVFVVILSAVVLIISRKRKLERLRHRLMPLYNFDPGEEGEDDWETELLDSEGIGNRPRKN